MLPRSIQEALWRVEVSCNSTVHCPHLDLSLTLGVGGGFIGLAKRKVYTCLTLYFTLSYFALVQTVLLKSLNRLLILLTFKFPELTMIVNGDNNKLSSKVL